MAISIVTNWKRTALSNMLFVDRCFILCVLWLAFC